MSEGVPVKGVRIAVAGRLDIDVRRKQKLEVAVVTVDDCTETIVIVAVVITSVRQSVVI